MLVYWVTTILEKTSKEQNETGKVHIKFDVSFYLVAAAGVSSVIATGLSILHCRRFYRTRSITDDEMSLELMYSMHSAAESFSDQPPPAYSPWEANRDMQRKTPTGSQSLQTRRYSAYLLGTCCCYLLVLFFLIIGQWVAQYHMNSTKVTTLKMNECCCNPKISIIKKFQHLEIKTIYLPQWALPNPNKFLVEHIFMPPLCVTWSS